MVSAAKALDSHDDRDLEGAMIRLCFQSERQGPRKTSLFCSASLRSSRLNAEDLRIQLKGFWSSWHYGDPGLARDLPQVFEPQSPLSSLNLNDLQRFPARSSLAPQPPLRLCSGPRCRRALTF